jgi:tRNA A-37 threonylcarbamoyl transferase component Bud32
MSRLRKPSTGNMKSMKYLVNCQEKIDASDDKWLEVVRKIQDNDILIGKMSTKSVVIKFGKNIPIQKEYEISKKIYEKNVPNFIKFYCTFTCLEDVNKFKQIETVEKSIKLCSKPGVKTWFVVMPYYQFGSISNYKWTSDKYNILLNLIQQAVLALYEAYKTTGFVHMDLHLGNILLKKTNKNEIDYIFSKNNIRLVGYEAILMDFELSNLDKDEDEFKNSLYKMANSLRDPSKTGEIILESHTISPYIRKMNVNDNSINTLINKIGNMKIDYIKRKT